MLEDPQTVKGKVGRKKKERRGSKNWPEPRVPVRYFKRWLYASYRSGAGIMHNWNLRITPKGWFVLGCLCLAAFLGLDTNRTTAYQIFAFLFALVGVAASMTPFMRGKFQIRRDLPRYGSVGVPLSYNVHIRNLNDKRYRELFIWENVPDPRPSLEEFAFTPEPGEKFRNPFDRLFIYYRWRWLMDRREVAEVQHSRPFSLGPRQETQVQMRLVPLRRGILHLESSRVIRMDPFALFRGDAWPRVDSSRLLILPRRYSLPRIDLGGERHYQQGGASVAGAYGHSEEFVSLREYRPGDPLRHIHWRSWARLGQPIVKEFEEQYFPRYALVLDTFAHPDAEHLFEEAVSVAASFAYALNTNDSLLDLLFVGTEAFSFTAGKGAGSIEKMLEILASIQPHLPPELPALQRLLAQRIREISAIIVVLTGWDKEREEFLSELRRHGRRILPIALVDARPSGTTPAAPRRAKRDVLTEGEMAPDYWAEERARTGVNFVPYGRVQEFLGRLVV
jgi:uncharacterized protein (DUF58 family)